MTEQEIKNLVTKQRNYFLTGATLPVSTRIDALHRLYAAITEHEKEINDALRKDLGKSGFESYMCETGMVLEELSYMIKHTKRFAGEKRVRTPLAQFHSRSYQKPSPYGVTLIMSPWNYPFMLTLSPLADALAAGNTAVVKPSAYSPYTSEVILRILSQCFEPQYVAVVTGGRAENTCLLREHFDYIFFTGSQAVGKEVMRNAAEHLTPVTLELGGKSPCIVDQTANIRLAAKRIVFGKYLNCGQTCVAPDYIYCHRSIKDKLIKEVRKQIQKQYGKQPLRNPNYGKIINEKHFDCDDRAQTRLAAQFAIAKPDTDVVWLDYDYEPVTFSYEQFVQLCNTATNIVSAIEFLTGQYLSAVEECETVEEIKAIEADYSNAAISTFLLNQN